MIPRTSLPAAALALARRQAGALSREQLVGLGVSDRVLDRLKRQYHITPLTHGVYALQPGGWLQKAWTGVLLGGPSAVLGMQAAAHLSGLLPEAPDEIVVYTPTHHRPRGDPWRFIESRRTGWAEPPRTRIPQTVVDLSAELRDDAIISLVAEAVGRGRARAGDVLAILQGTPRHPKRALLTELLREVTDGVHSPLELRYVREVERRHGLPVALRQASVVAGRRSDGWYPEFGLVIELDGKAYHSGAHALDDMERDNEHLLDGVVTLRFGWRQVTSDPCRVAAVVAQALTRAGWTGVLRPCSRCRRTFHTELGAKRAAFPG